MYCVCPLLLCGHMVKGLGRGTYGLGLGLGLEGPGLGLGLGLEGPGLGLGLEGGGLGLGFGLEILALTTSLSLLVEFFLFVHFSVWSV